MAPRKYAMVLLYAMIGYVFFLKLKSYHHLLVWHHCIAFFRVLFSYGQKHARVDVDLF